MESAAAARALARRPADLRENFMSAKHRIGSYRHIPADEILTGPDGQRYHTHSRRRMPFAAQVFVGYAAMGPLLALAVAALLKKIANGSLLPDVIASTKLPPCPSPQNVLFGASWVEAVLACGFTGWWLWTLLWKTRFSVEEVEGGTPLILPILVKRGLRWSLMLTPVAGLLVTFSLYLRTAPPEQPWLVRPLFALFAAFPMGIGALWTGIIPLVMLLLGLLVGGVTGVLVSLLYPHYPDEPITR